MTIALEEAPTKLAYEDPELDEEVVHVFPSHQGWHVKPVSGKESIHGRKALAALFAKQIAANAPKNGRVIFYQADGSVETIRTFECLMCTAK
jgi:hypothetical protein